MQGELVAALRNQRPQIRARWAALLHAEPVTTPLGHPDALVHLIDWTLDELIHGLHTLPSRRQPARSVHDCQSSCPCGRNPLLTYFSAGEQALREALVLAQAALPGLDAVERDASLNELDLVLQQIARREIEAFCGVCQFRPREHAIAGPHATHATPV